jgi:hypothetical protein
LRSILNKIKGSAPGTDALAGAVPAIELGVYVKVNWPVGWSITVSGDTILQMVLSVRPGNTFYV